MNSTEFLTLLIGTKLLGSLVKDDRKWPMIVRDDRRLLQISFCSEVKNMSYGPQADYAPLTRGHSLYASWQGTWMPWDYQGISSQGIYGPHTQEKHLNASSKRHHVACLLALRDRELGSG